MSKKLICLFLGIIMLLGVLLTSCGERDDDALKEDISSDASETAETIRIYLMSENKIVDDPTDPDDTYSKIVDAINAITKKKFKTKVEVCFYTEDEYYDKLEAAFAARDKAVANGFKEEVKEDDGETGGDENTYDSSGFVVYPTIRDDQVDIFYLGGKDKLDKYVAENRLTRLDDNLTNSSKALSKNIPSQLMSNIKSLNNGKTWAIPTSKPIGDYTFLLVNKSVVSYYTEDRMSNITSLTCDDAKTLLSLVNNGSVQGAEDMYTLYTNVSDEELFISNINYWGVDENGNLSDDFSVLGGYYDDSKDYLEEGATIGFENLFNNATFVNDMAVLKEYEINGYYAPKNYDPTAEGAKDFAVGYIKGGYEVISEYGEDYEVIVLSSPRLEEEEIYSDMFGVCSYTRNLGRSMKVLSLLNTDEEFRNLLLYGVEEEHYHLQDTGIVNEYGEPIMAVKRTEKGEQEYVMSESKTGNTLLTYPVYDEDNPMINYYGIEQNKEAKVSLDLGFTTDSKVDMSSLKAINTLSDQILNEYKACKTSEELAAFIKKYTEKDENGLTILDKNEAIAKHIGTDSGSLLSCYNSWLTAKKIVK